MFRSFFTLFNIFEASCILSSFHFQTELKYCKALEKSRKRPYTNCIILNEVHHLTSHHNISIGIRAFVVVTVSVQFNSYYPTIGEFWRATDYQILICGRMFPQTCTNFRETSHISQASRISARYPGNTMWKWFPKIENIWYAFFIWRRKDRNCRFSILMTVRYISQL